MTELQQNLHDLVDETGQDLMVALKALADGSGKTIALTITVAPGEESAGLTFQFRKEASE
jgi:hypothetical protein